MESTQVVLVAVVDSVERAEELNGQFKDVFKKTE